MATTKVETSARKRGGPYPWDKWLAKRTKLVGGKDFLGRLDTMVVQIRNAASKRGIGLSLSVDEANKTITINPK